MQSRREFIGRSITALSAAAVLDPRALIPRSAPKTILILGGTGFIGPHHVRHALSRGHKVTIFNRGRSAPGMLKTAGFLAAQGIKRCIINVHRL